MDMHEVPSAKQARPLRVWRSAGNAVRRSEEFPVRVNTLQQGQQATRGRSPFEGWAAR